MANARLFYDNEGFKAWADAIESGNPVYDIPYEEAHEMGLEEDMVGLGLWAERLVDGVKIYFGRFEDISSPPYIVMTREQTEAFIDEIRDAILSVIGNAECAHEKDYLVFGAREWIAGTLVDNPLDEGPPCPKEGLPCTFNVQGADSGTASIGFEVFVVESENVVVLDTATAGEIIALSCLLRKLLAPAEED